MSGRRDKLRKAKQSWSRIVGHVKKEFVLYTRSPTPMILGVVVPVIVLLMFAAMLHSIPETDSYPTIVVSYDSDDHFSRNETLSYDNYTIMYLESVEDTESLDLIQFYNATENVYAMKEARERLMDGEVSCIISIPVEFSELLLLGYPGIMDCMIDGSDLQDIQHIINALQESLSSFIETNNLTPRVEIESREIYDSPEDYNDTYNFRMLMLLPFFFIGIARGLTGIVVVQDEPAGRLLLTPSKRYEIMAAKYISYTALMMIQFAILLFVLVAAGLYVAGSLIDLYVAICVIGLSGLCISMMLSAVSKTKVEANRYGYFMLVIFLMLSGIFVDIEDMPPYLQLIVNLSPMPHGTLLVDGILAKGSSVFNFHFLHLLTFSAVMCFLSFIIYQRKRYEV